MIIVPQTTPGFRGLSRDVPRTLFQRARWRGVRPDERSPRIPRRDGAAPNFHCFPAQRSNPQPNSVWRGIHFDGVEICGVISWGNRAAVDPQDRTCRASY